MANTTIRTAMDLVGQDIIGSSLEVWQPAPGKITHGPITDEAYENGTHVTIKCDWMRNLTLKNMKPGRKWTEGPYFFVGQQGPANRFGITSNNDCTMVHIPKNQKFGDAPVHEAMVNIDSSIHLSIRPCQHIIEDDNTASIDPEKYFKWLATKLWGGQVWVWNSKRIFQTTFEDARFDGTNIFSPAQNIQVSSPNGWEKFLYHRGYLPPVFDLEEGQMKIVLPGEVGNPPILTHEGKRIWFLYGGWLMMIEPKDPITLSEFKPTAPKPPSVKEPSSTCLATTLPVRKHKAVSKKVCEHIFIGCQGLIKLIFEKVKLKSKSIGVIVESEVTAHSLRDLKFLLFDTLDEMPSSIDPQTIIWWGDDQVPTDDLVEAIQKTGLLGPGPRLGPIVVDCTNSGMEDQRDRIRELGDRYIVGDIGATNDRGVFKMNELTLSGSIISTCALTGIVNLKTLLGLEPQFKEVGQ
ncbi:hypothetical protein CL634_11160 [bacterium]|nr:hypothetical protein [bacterium]|tara:strand:+ start:799 stop:2190 length:1392 start_codon:yes stop_codon:yes gene_type:complete